MCELGGGGCDCLAPEVGRARGRCRLKRKALLKTGDHFVVLEESKFEAETQLQEALKLNPEVIPVSDLDLAEVVVVGRETVLPVGAIDLLLVDADGRLIIVETKLSSNPELRRQA